MQDEKMLVVSSIVSEIRSMNLDGQSDCLARLLEVKETLLKEVWEHTDRTERLLCARILTAINLVLKGPLDTIDERYKKTLNEAMELLCRENIDQKAISSVTAKLASLRPGFSTLILRLCHR